MGPRGHRELQRNRRLFQGAVLERPDGLDAMPRDRAPDDETESVYLYEPWRAATSPALATGSSGVSYSIFAASDPTTTEAMGTSGP